MNITAKLVDFTTTNDANEQLILYLFFCIFLKDRVKTQRIIPLYIFRQHHFLSKCSYRNEE